MNHMGIGKHRILKIKKMEQLCISTSQDRNYEQLMYYQLPR